MILESRAKQKCNITVFYLNIHPLWFTLINLERVEIRVGHWILESFGVKNKLFYCLNNKTNMKYPSESSSKNKWYLENRFTSFS